MINRSESHVEERGGVAIRFETRWSDVMIRAEFAAATWDVTLDIIRELTQAAAHVPPEVLAEAAADLEAKGKELLGDMPAEVADFIRRHRAAT